ncbi:MAG TPA: hypothetical protein VHS33_03330 [Sphingomicrobium sp.]|nr:hypothetical protein [Sphingomicrobium sp.]
MLIPDKSATRVPATLFRVRASIVRRFHAHLLGAFAPRLLDFVDEPRDRLWLVKFHHDVFGRVGTSAHPARPSRAGLSIEQIFNRVSEVLG